MNFSFNFFFEISFLYCDHFTSPNCQRVKLQLQLRKHAVLLKFRGSILKPFSYIMKNEHSSFKIKNKYTYKEKVNATTVPLKSSPSHTVHSGHHLEPQIKKTTDPNNSTVTLKWSKLLRNVASGSSASLQLCFSAMCWKSINFTTSPWSPSSC